MQFTKEIPWKVAKTPGRIFRRILSRLWMSRFLAPIGTWRKCWPLLFPFFSPLSTPSPPQSILFLDPQAALFGRGNATFRVWFPQKKKIWSEYRSIQIHYRQRFFWEELISDYRYRIALREELISITETDLWEFLQKFSHNKHRFSLEFQLISNCITDTDFGLKTS